MWDWAETLLEDNAVIAEGVPKVIVLLAVITPPPLKPLPAIMLLFKLVAVSIVSVINANLFQFA